MEGNMAILKSLPKEKKKIIRSAGLLGSLYGLRDVFPKEEVITEEEPVPLTGVKVGDYVKSIA